MTNILISKVGAAIALVMVSVPTFASDFASCGPNSEFGNPCSVPEPGGLALMGVGIAVIAVSTYYKNRNK